MKSSKVKNLCKVCQFFLGYFLGQKSLDTPILYTTHAILELVNSISNSFEDDKFTLGNFSDFSKAFDMAGIESY